MLEAVYEMLKTTRPFKRWKLPHANEVEFHVVNKLKSGGKADYFFDGETHIIRIEANCHTTLPEIIETMAHEMCHEKQEISWPQDKSHHGRRFKKLAAQVCRYHEFDLKTF